MKYREVGTEVAEQLCPICGCVLVGQGYRKRASNTVLKPALPVGDRVSMDAATPAEEK
jgi:hypothetical protein